MHQRRKRERERERERERVDGEIESLLTVSGRRDSAGRPNSWTTRKITKR